jgi:hypothetical protein
VLPEQDMFLQYPVNEHYGRKAQKSKEMEFFAFVYISMKKVKQPVIPVV